MRQTRSISRRTLLAGAGTWAAAGWMGRRACGDEAAERAAARREVAADRSKALVAITLDLEMSRNFPTWETTHWDYEKGNLNDETKRYTVEACRRVKARGGLIHAFAVGRVCEQDNMDWLREITAAGHPVGNHTYDHVNVKATRPEEIQFRFRRAPWLLGGREPAEVIADNIRLTNVALAERIGIRAAGFRTPGGFTDGLADRPDVQALLQSLGFDWVSSKYPPHAEISPGSEPTAELLENIVAAQAEAQPFTYPSGLIEVPMSPVSDIVAFRGGRWKLDDFLRTIRLALEHVIHERTVFDLLAHPSCLYVTDPDFKTVQLVCDLVEQAKGQALLVDLATIAERGRTPGQPMNDK